MHLYRIPLEHSSVCSLEVTLGNLALSFKERLLDRPLGQWLGRSLPFVS